MRRASLLVVPALFQRNVIGLYRSTIVVGVRDLSDLSCDGFLNELTHRVVAAGLSAHQSHGRPGNGVKSRGMFTELRAAPRMHSRLRAQDRRSRHRLSCGDFPAGEQPKRVGHVVQHGAVFVTDPLGAIPV